MNYGHVQLPDWWLPLVRKTMEAHGHTQQDAARLLTRALGEEITQTRVSAYVTGAVTTQPLTLGFLAVYPTLPTPFWSFRTLDDALAYGQKANEDMRALAKEMRQAKMADGTPIDGISVARDLPASTVRGTKSKDR